MASRKKLLLFVAAFTLLFNISFALFYFLVLSESDEQEAIEVEPVLTPEEAAAVLAAEEDAKMDHYYSVVFSYNDAVDLCFQETQSRNNNIIILTVNEHSTRFRELDQMYLVKLDSQVGTPALYDEKTHTCEIDPKIQGVTFYKEIFRRKAVRPAG